MAGRKIIRRVGRPTQVSSELRDTADTLKKTYFCERRRHTVMRHNSDGTAVGHFKAWSAELSIVVREEADWDADYVHTQHPEHPKRKKAARVATKDAVWLDLAKFISEQRLDPAYFIRAQFYFITPLDKVPFPNAFKRASAVKNLATMAKSFVSQYQVVHKSCFELFENNVAGLVSSYAQLSKSGLEPPMDWVEAALTVLSDPHNELDVLFKYCFANKIRHLDKSFKEFMQQCRLPAALEYARFSTYYDQVCGAEWITTGLKKNSQKVYEQVYSGTYDY